MNIPDTKQKRVVVIGGGFAGVNLAKSLSNKPAQVVVFDKRNYHLFQPLLYQVATASLEPDSVAYPLRKLFKKQRNTYFRMAEALSIDAERKLVQTDIGALRYDYLVLATGATTNFFGNEQVANASMPMKSIPEALNIRSLVIQNFEQATIAKSADEQRELLTFVIVGGGPTGVELAGALAEFKKHIFPKDYREVDAADMRIHLLEGAPRLLPSMSEFAGRKAFQYLDKLGVEIHTGASVTGYDASGALLSANLKLRAKTVIWAAGVIGVAPRGLNKDALIAKSGRYKVNQFSQVLGYEDVFAIGDVAYMESAGYPNGHPQVAPPAIQQGRALGKNILRLIRGEAPRPFKYRDLGAMATIGRNRAVVDLGRVRFGGFAAWLAWVFIHIMALVGFRNKAITFFNWAYSYINFDRPARLIIRPFKPFKKR